MGTRGFWSKVLGLGIEDLGNNLVIGVRIGSSSSSSSSSSGGSSRRVVSVCGEFADFGTVAGAGTGAGDIGGEGSEVED